MTPEDRAKLTREKMLSVTRPGGYIDNAEIERVIAAAIREAATAERKQTEIAVEAYIGSWFDDRGVLLGGVYKPNVVVGELLSLLRSRRPI